MKMVSDKITKTDILNLKSSWGDNWEKYTGEKREVARKANELAKRMIGKGWIPHVSENLGWYYEVYNGTLHVHPSQFNGKTTYYCMFSKDNEYWGVGEDFWDNVKCYNDPNEAVKEQIKIAQDFVNQCQSAINKVKNNIVNMK